jgi:hypothetical protein
MTRRALVERLLEQFERNVLPKASHLRRAVIHNDANDQNILVDEAGTELVGKTNQPFHKTIPFGNTNQPFHKTIPFGNSNQFITFGNINQPTHFRLHKPTHPLLVTNLFW